jgi:hypothetical protein
VYYKLTTPSRVRKEGGKKGNNTCITLNLEASNICGSLKLPGLWWMFLNSGITFHPLGIRNPAIKSNKKKIHPFSLENTSSLSNRSANFTDRTPLVMF